MAGRAGLGRRPLWARGRHGARPAAPQAHSRRAPARGGTWCRRANAADPGGFLERAGLLDDERLARARAESLAERGWGNEAIVARLGSEGLDEDVARAAAAELAPEGDRAGRLAGTETDPRRIASLLSRRGFGEDVVEAALARLDADG
ncbi:MAG: RecX family transcriptional regulator [Actinobacteria bacterium]|nr:MAG: RecX family transcriptional regulator [Actinomycetota bacterium]